MRPTPDEIRAHAARWPTANGGGLWRQRLYGTTHHPVRLLEIQPGHEEGTPLAFDERTEWTPCTPDGDPVHLVEERDYHRDQYEKMQAQREEYRRQRDELATKLAKAHNDHRWLHHSAEQERDAAIAAKAEAREAYKHIESLQATVTESRQERDELQQQVYDLASKLAALRQNLGISR